MSIIGYSLYMEAIKPHVNKSGTEGVKQRRPKNQLISGELMKKLGLLAILLVTMSTAAFAAGGDASGGGNTVNSKLIEEFTIEPEALGDGHKLAQEYMQNIKEAVPSFGKDLEDAANSIVWYSLPKKFRELPASVTGISFPSDQPVYQNHNEVFISAEDFPNLKTETQAKILMHEVVMMATPYKKGYMVRQLMTFLIKSNFKPNEKELVKKLKALGYGEYLLKSEYAGVQARAVRDAQLDLKDYFQGVELHCSREYFYIPPVSEASQLIYRIDLQADRDVSALPKLPESNYMFDVFKKNFFTNIKSIKAFKEFEKITKTLNHKKQETEFTREELKERKSQICQAAKKLEIIISPDGNVEPWKNREPANVLAQEKATDNSAMLESKNIPIKQSTTAPATSNSQAEQTEIQSTK